MKKLIVAGAAIAVGAAVAWSYRTELMLGVVKFQSDREYPIAENKEIQWQQGPAEPTGEQRPPNIVVIMLDDVGYNDISAIGTGVANGALKTPSIDALAQQSTVFTNGYAGNATCAPSRAMTMTGRYPTSTGFEFTPFPGSSKTIAAVANSLNGPGEPETRASDANNTPYPEQGLPGSEQTIAEMLATKGYHNVHIGKWHLGRSAESSPNAQGFDESLLMQSGLYLPEDHPDVVNAKIDFDPIDRFLWARLRYAASYNNPTIDPKTSDAFEPRGYITDYYTEEAVKVIHANKNRPFFLYLAHWGIHTPLQATREDYEAVGDIKPHRLRVYAAMMRSLDRSVQKVMQALEDAGVADNTMVVFTNDNGAPGYVGLSELNAPYRGWKLSFFEGGIKVPYFVKWPKGVEAPAVSDVPVGHIDILPTIAAITGAAPEAKIDGIDLLTIVNERQPETRPLYFQSGFLQAVRFGQHKLMRSQLQNKLWLFDLENDPTEQINLAEQRPELVAELTKMIDDHQAQGVGALYPYSLEAPIAIDKTLDQPIEDSDEVVYWAN